MRKIRSTNIPYVKIRISGTTYTFVHAEDIEVFPITGHTLNYNLLKRPVIGYTGGFFYDFAGSGFSIINPSNSPDAIFKEANGTWPPNRSQLYNTEIGFFPEQNNTPIFLGQSRILSWDENKGIPKVTFKVQPLNPIGYKLFNGELQTDYLGQTQGNVFTIGDFKNAPTVVESSTSSTTLFNATGANPSQGIVVYNNSEPIAVNRPGVETVSLTSAQGFIDMTQSSDDPVEDLQPDSWMTRDLIGAVLATGAANSTPSLPRRVSQLRDFYTNAGETFSTSGSTTINSTLNVGRSLLTRKFLSRNLYVTDSGTTDKFTDVVVNQLVGLSADSGGTSGGDTYSSTASIDFSDDVTISVQRDYYSDGRGGIAPVVTDFADNRFITPSNVTDSQTDTDFEVKQLYSIHGTQFTDDLTSALNVFDNDVLYYKYKESNFTLEFDKSNVTVNKVFNPDGVDIVGDNSNSTWTNALYQVDEIASGSNPSWTNKRGTVVINYSNGEDSVAAIKKIVVFGSKVQLLLDTSSELFAGRTVTNIVTTTSTVSLLGQSTLITGAHNIDFTATSISSRYYYGVEMSKPVFFFKSFYEYSRQRESDPFHFITDNVAGGVHAGDDNDHTGSIPDVAKTYAYNQVDNEGSFSGLNYYPRQISIGNSKLSSSNINNLIESIDGGNKLRVLLLTENNIGNVTIDGISRIIPTGSVDSILQYIATRLQTIGYEPFPGETVSSVVVKYDPNANAIKDFIIGSTAFSEVLTFKEILSKIGEWSGLQFGYTYTRTSSTVLELTINCNFSLASTYTPVRTFKLDDYTEKPNPVQNMIPDVILASTKINVRAGSGIEEKDIVVQFTHDDFVLPTSIEKPIGGETITVEHINNKYVSTDSSDEMKQFLQGKFEQMARSTDNVTIPEIDLSLVHGDIIECDSEVLGVTETYRIVGISSIDTENKQMKFKVEVINSKPLKKRR